MEIFNSRNVYIRESMKIFGVAKAMLVNTFTKG